MEGDEKRTPGELLDEMIVNLDYESIDIKIKLKRKTPKSPEPGKPAKETR